MSLRLIVECRTRGCPAAGVSREVPVDLVALGVYAKPDLFCVRCNGAVFEVESPAKAAR